MAMRLHQAGPVERHPLVFESIAEPKPTGAEVVIRVHVCGVCRTDLHIVEGELAMSRTPIVPGHEVVGTVIDRGPDARRLAVGDRVGIAWLHRTCGTCEFCRADADRENLCRDAAFTGWTVDGGYAEYLCTPESFAYPIPVGFDDEQAAPLLCAGIIGYRALRLSGIKGGQRLALYGFGASAHLAIQIAKYWGCEVYVFTRSPGNRSLAERLGATWTGETKDAPPAKAHAAISFAPAGPLVLDALEGLERGGVLALAGIYMTPVPAMDYRRHLYDEKVVRSVTNGTRKDGEELMSLAACIPLRTTTQTFPLEQANDALLALKTGEVRGAAVLDCRGDQSGPPHR